MLTQNFLINEINNGIHVLVSDHFTPNIAYGGESLTLYTKRLLLEVQGLLEKKILSIQRLDKVVRMISSMYIYIYIYICMRG